MKFGQFVILTKKSFYQKIDKNVVWKLIPGHFLVLNISSVKWNLKARADFDIFW